MRKILISFLAVMVLCCGFILGCTEENCATSPEKPEEVVFSPILNEYELNLEIYEDFQLVVTNSEKTATWTSGNKNVISVENGKVKAVGVGSTNVVVTVDGAQATCKVNVSNNNLVPVIQSGVIEDEIFLYTGMSYEISPVITYNAKEYSDAKFTLNCNDDGLEISGLSILAKANGNYDVELSATWREYGELLSVIIPVNVQIDAQIQTQKNIDVFTSTINGDENVYNLTAVYVEDGNILDKQISWEIVDGQDVISLNGNVIKGIDGGVAHVIGKVIASDETEVISPIITINVTIPKVETNKSFFIEMEEETRVDVEVPSGNAILGISDGDREYEFNVDNSTVKGISFGEKVWNIYSTDANGDKVAYVYDVTVASLVIREAEDLSKMFEGISSSDKGYTYDGYIILANDIDATGYNHKSWANWSGMYDGAGRTGEGFQGYFDGNGYTISNLRLDMNENYAVCGVFGTIGENAIIKNVAFTNLTSGSTNKTNWLSSMLAINVFGGTIENVFLSSADFFMSPILYVSNGSSFTNFVSYGKEYLFKSFTNMIDAGEIAIDNVITIGDKAGINAGNNLTVDMLLNDFELDFKDNAEFKSLNLKDMFDNEYWTTDSATIPVFNSMIKENTIELTEGSSFDFASLGKYTSLSVEELPRGVEVNGTTISLSTNLNVEEFTIYASEGELEIKNKINVIVISGLEISGKYYLEQVNANNTTLDLSAYLNGQTINQIKIKGEVISSNSYSISAGKLTLNKDFVQSLDMGEINLTIITNDNSYYLSATVVTKVITKASDLQLIFANEQWLGTDEDGRATTYDGYFVLGNDIDATGTTIYSTYNWSGYYDSASRVLEGFQGVFDGCGYTIKGLTVNARLDVRTSSNSDLYSGGVFGTIGVNGVVKNVAFVDVTTDAMYNAVGGIAMNLFGTLDNVFFHTKDDFFAPIGYLSGGATITNCVFYGSNYQSKGVAQMVDVGQATAIAEPITIENLLAISNCDSMNNECAAYANITRFDITTYQSDNAFKAIDFTERFNCAENGLWYINEALSLPIFKSSAKYFDVSNGYITDGYQGSVWE